MKSLKEVAPWWLKIGEIAAALWFLEALGAF
jgi:hypothetical protein